MTQGSRPVFLELLQRQREVGERFAKQVKAIQKGLAEDQTPGRSSPPQAELLRESLQVFVDLRKDNRAHGQTGVDGRSQFKLMVVQFSMWFERLSPPGSPAAAKEHSDLLSHVRTTLNSIGRKFDLELIMPLMPGSCPSEELNRPQWDGRFKTEDGSEFITGRSYRPVAWGLQSTTGDGQSRIEMAALFRLDSSMGSAPHAEGGAA